MDAIKTSSTTQASAEAIKAASDAFNATWSPTADASRLNIIGEKGSQGDPKGPETTPVDSNPEIERLKKALDKATKEAGDYRKQLQARMTQDELARQEAEQKQNDLQEKYNELLRRSTIADHTAKYMAMPGYDEKLARNTAEALYDGDMDKVFANQQKANEAYAKQLLAEQMRSMTPPAGGGSEQTEPDNIRLAKELGKLKAQRTQQANDTLKRFMRKE